MLRGDKELMVVGDRVLIRVDEVEERTEVGLYLPPTAIEKESVQSGKVEEVGPGIALPPRVEDEEAPWNEEKRERSRFIPLQAHKGDTAVFLKRDAVEIKFDSQKYMVVPYQSILVLVRPVAPLSEMQI